MANDMFGLTLYYAQQARRLRSCSFSSPLSPAVRVEMLVFPNDVRHADSTQAAVCMAQRFYLLPQFHLVGS